MNYYNPYTGNKKRIFRRITTVLVCALIITGSTVIFGNYLKKKANSTSGNDYAGIGREDISTETESAVVIPQSEEGAGSSVSVKGLCIPLGAAENVVVTGDDDPAASSDDSFEARLTAAAEGHTGVLIPLTGDDGFLLYNSKRAGESSRLPSNPSIPDMEALSAAVSLAKSLGLRVSALIGSGVSLSGTEDECNAAITTDARIAADAAEAGFDEIIISSLVSSAEDITGESSHIILKYLNQMTEAAGSTAVGLSLPTDVYLTATLSPQIELFISRSVFLTMELTAEQSNSDYLNYICENLAGTLSVYNMRILFSPTDTAVGNDFTDKLKAVEHENYLYASVPEEAQTPDVGADVTDTAFETDEPDSTENPNVTE